MDWVIRAEKLGKKYLIRHKSRPRYETLRDTLAGRAKRLMKKADTGGTEDFWALLDVSFEVRPGDKLGIIGRNGAGKTTLLKILSRITEPSKGRVEISGRVSSMLEVGTGFHPELTGRENVFLNGAILGMRRREIVRKFDEIVAFAEVEKFLDTPVKFYSSGMYVRLAFAVAAHLEPEILIVDEVLAVGDAEFQKKAMGKMREVSRNDGRAVLFVSHNMTAVKNLCKTGIMLQNGTVKYAGDMAAVVDHYLANEMVRGNVNGEWEKENAPGTEKVKVKKAYVIFEGTFITVNTPFDIITEFWIEEERFPVNVSMHLVDANNSVVFAIATPNVLLPKGIHKAVFHIPANLMNDGFYSVNNMFVTNSRGHFFHEAAHSFEIIEEREVSGWHGKWPGKVRPTFIKSEIM
jgi:lipopolysaccharide transport system ATP-binding protein